MRRSGAIGCRQVIDRGQHEQSGTLGSAYQCRHHPSPVGNSPARLRHGLYRRSSVTGLLRKSDGHGVRRHRPPSLRHDPGTTPPRAEPTPSGPAQKHDNKTHRRVLASSGRKERPGTARSAMADAGREKSPRGSGWPPTKGIVWIRIRKRRAFLRKTGGGSGGRILSQALTD